MCFVCERALWSASLCWWSVSLLLHVKENKVIIDACFNIPPSPVSPVNAHERSRECSSLWKSSYRRWLLRPGGGCSCSTASPVEGCSVSSPTAMWVSLCVGCLFQYVLSLLSVAVCDYCELGRNQHSF